MKTTEKQKTDIKNLEIYALLKIALKHLFSRYTAINPLPFTTLANNFAKIRTIDEI